MRAVGGPVALAVLVQFEQVRALLQEVWPGAQVDTVRPVTILAARDEASLRALLPYVRRENIVALRRRTP